jgi:hypothetical protein
MRSPTELYFKVHGQLCVVTKILLVDSLVSATIVFSPILHIVFRCSLLTLLRRP